MLSLERMIQFAMSESRSRARKVRSGSIVNCSQWLPASWKAAFATECTQVPVTHRSWYHSPSAFWQIEIWSVGHKFSARANPAVNLNFFKLRYLACAATRKHPCIRLLFRVLPRILAVAIEFLCRLAPPLLPAQSILAQIGPA